ncbi:MAG: DUF1345 domain-containing protein [Beijerinckiaceae bacterium]
MSDTRAELERIFEDGRARLAAHRKRVLPLRVLAARPRFFIAVVIGALAGILTPDVFGIMARALIGWNAAALAYIALALISIRGATRHRMRFDAEILADGRFIVLAFSAIAAIAAIGAIVAQLSVAKDLHGVQRAGHLILAACTIVSSWAFIHMVFALHYAHEYYLERRMAGADDDAGDPFDLDRDGDVDEKDFEIAAREDIDPRGGLKFPGTQQPTYPDFVYFSYIIGVASQTADVEITTKPMRTVSLAHSILAFFFNTAILALTINLAASLF